MRMDDSVSIGKLDVASQSQTGFDASTRILCQLTADGLEHGAPWQASGSAYADVSRVGVLLA